MVSDSEVDRRWGKEKTAFSFCSVLEGVGVYAVVSAHSLSHQGMQAGLLPQPGGWQVRTRTRGDHGKISHGWNLTL